MSTKAHGLRAQKSNFLSSFLCLVLVLSIQIISLTGCGAADPSDEELAEVDYTPISNGNWAISTPEASGLDPMLIARLYFNAGRVETITSLLVIKDGFLIAEKYFHDGSPDKKNRMQSVTKSVTSALTGIALDQGHLTSVDQKMIDFFPELANQITDPRKSEITIEQLLQMRAGYPWEESTEELFTMLYSGFHPSLLADVPLKYSPGTDMEYSSLTSHILGIVVARATGIDLLTYAQENLFNPLGIEPGEWIKDWEGYYNGHADLHMTARDMAKFGLLYLDGGVHEGKQIVSAEWVRDSLQTYSENAWDYRVGRNVADMGYGYQWWSAQADDHRYSFAWGHGGQQIALVPELNMVIVVTADPLVGEHGDRPWKLEKQNLNLVGDFIASLPMS